LRETRFAIIGYGNQGRAQALNLRESGASVVIGARAGGAGSARASSEGFASVPIAEAVRQADLLVMALPDQSHAEVWERDIAPHARRESVVGFLHGFSVHFGAVQPPASMGVVMVAPKGPGHALRARFNEGLGIPALFAVHQGGTDPARTRALGLAWAHGIGCGRAAIVETTFAAEAETDLFGEQAVLCGGMMALVQEAFRALVEAGYTPELAYMECCQELKQLADLVFERGLSGMRGAISDTAEFGAFVAQERLVDGALRQRLRALLGDIRGGAFARAFQEDAKAGFPWMQAQRDRASADPIEQAGRAVRGWLPWLPSSEGNAKS
jgi:ketol-acid reductoisomerase